MGLHDTLPHNCVWRCSRHRIPLFHPEELLILVLKIEKYAKKSLDVVKFIYIFPEYTFNLRDFRV